MSDCITNCSKIKHLWTKLYLLFINLSQKSKTNNKQLFIAALLYGSDNRTNLFYRRFLKLNITIHWLKVLQHSLITVVKDEQFTRIRLLSVLSEIKDLWCGNSMLSNLWWLFPYYLTYSLKWNNYNDLFSYYSETKKSWWEIWVWSCC